jgi:predicted nucleic acid-binding protein
VSYLLDTNVVSEWNRPRPDPGVIRWLHEADEDRIYISVATLAELRRGVERLPLGVRRSLLNDWLEGDLQLRFEGRILVVDAAVADICGRMTAKREAAGRPIGAMDAVLAATADCHGLDLVTRNVRDFELLDLTIVNPWSA